MRVFAAQRVTLSDNPFHVSAWRPVDGFDLTDITNHRHIADGKAQPTPADGGLRPRPGERSDFLCPRGTLQNQADL
jgi:hypothetical protein